MNAVVWILHPLVSYILLTAGMSVSVYLFVSVKAGMRVLERRHLDEQKQRCTLEAALGESRLAVQELENDLREVQRQTGMLVAPVPARSGLNLTKRTQVLRMHRSGQDGAGIASALALPRAEVDLLIKVHRIVVEQI